MPRIFLSHAGADEREAVALQHWLAENGWDDVFLDVDPERGLVAGERWQEALRQAVDRCEAIVFVVSPSWAKSKWCLAEFLLARNLHKHVFVVLVEEVPLGELPTEMTAEWQVCRLAGPGPSETVPFRYRNAEDAVQFLSDGLRGLKTGLQKAGLSAESFPWPPKDDPHRSPFRGLEPLDVPDAAVFFGRDVEILRALDGLRGLRESRNKRLFVILGASGVGKSSFLRAGLLPRLGRDDRHFVPLGVVRPETAPISGDRGLAQALHQAMQNLRLPATTVGELKARLASGPAEFSAVLRSIQEAGRARLVRSAGEPVPPTPTVVLPLDQAEELFNADAGPEARQFLRLIADVQREAPGPTDASSSPVSLIVIFTIRSDRYEPLQTASELAGLQIAVFDDLKPMPATRFREVITGQARQALVSGRPLEIRPDLLERLVEDCTTGADTLPLLGLTLERLYHDYGSDGNLRLDEYVALGGLDKIVKNKIESVLAGGGERRNQQLALLRSAFIPWLVTINLRDDQPMRRVARRSDLPADSLPLADALAENRLILRDWRQGEPVMEIAHDALLRQWELMSHWLEEERAALKAADAIERQACDWRESRQDESWLWGGQRLQDALALATRPAFQRRLRPCADFLNACQTARAREQRKARWIRLLKAGSSIAVVVALLALMLLGGASRLSLSRRAAAAADSILSQGGDPVESLRQAASAVESLPGWLVAAGIPPFPRQLDAAVFSLRRATAASHSRHPTVMVATNLNSASLSPDSTLIAAGGKDAAVTLFDAVTGRQRGQPLELGAELLGCTFSHDGLQILAHIGGRFAVLWNWKTLSTNRLDHGARVHHAAFAPAPLRMAATAGRHESDGPHKGKVILWRLGPAGTPPVPEATSDFAAEVKYAAFSPDGEAVLAVTGTPPDGSLYSWNQRTPEAPPRRFSASSVIAAEWSPTGANLLTVHFQGGLYSISVWQWPSGNLLTSRSFSDRVFSALFDPSGTLVLTACGDRLTRVWNFQDFSEGNLSILRGHTGAVTSARYGGTGALIVTASADGTVRRWEAPEGEFGRQTSARILGSGSLVTNRAGTLRVATTTNMIPNLAPASPVLWLESVPGGSRLRAVYTNRPPAGPAEGGDVLALDSSADDRFLLAGCEDRRALLFEHPGGRWESSSWLPVVLPHAEGVTAVAFHPGNEAILATGSSDLAVRLWMKVEDRWDVFAVLRGHTSPVSELQFSPDGDTLVARSEAGQRTYSCRACGPWQELVRAAQRH